MIPEGNVPLHELYDRFSNLDPDGIGRLGLCPAQEAAADRWWAEIDRRQADSLAKFKTALEAGQLTAKVYDPETGRVFVITREQWQRHSPMLVSSIQAETILEWGNDGLAVYNGLQPFVAQSDGELFLATHYGLPSKVTATRRGRKPKYDWPVFEKATREVLEDEGEPGVCPEWSTQADLERRMTDWIEKEPGWASVPAESLIREHVGRVLEAFKKEKAEK